MYKRLALILVAALLLTLPAFAQDEAISQWAIWASASSQYGDTAWSAWQATGEPNALDCSDNGYAWASETSTEEATLTVYFAVPVQPTELNIHQNYNPGGVSEIILLTPDGDEIEVDDSGEVEEDECPAIHSFELDDVEEYVNGVSITVDQSEIGNWSEIDAVEIVGVPDPAYAFQQWAIDAKASSQYGEDVWSAAQAIGEPDSLICGDQTTAWASASASEVATLTVYFETPVVPAMLLIYQNFNPGAISEVTLITEAGDEIELDGSGLAPDFCPAPHVVEIEGVDELINGVIITVDQTETLVWSEIDAVQLIGAAEGGGSEPGESSEGDTLELDGFSIDYPAGWATTIDEGGVPVLASSEDVLDNRNDLAEGDIVMTIILPDILEGQLELDPDGDITELLQGVLDLAQVEADIAEWDALDTPSVIAYGTSEETGNAAALIIVDYDDGAVLFAIDSGSDFEEVESQIADIINTASYEG